MTTLAALKAEIQSDIPRANASGLPLDEKINEAIRFYQRERFYFNVIDNVDVTLVVGQSAYTTATVKAITRIDDAALILADGYAGLTRVHSDEIESMLAGSPDNGEPSHYCYSGQKLRLYPPPDDTYTLRIHGESKLAGPASDTEADNAWMVEAYDLIKWRAEWALWSSTFQGSDGVESQFAKAAENEQLEILKAETNKRHATGSIVPTEF